ncbi:cell division ATP-binding protein FtsE [Microbacterium sp. 179-B 1A2 NHS]|uniref:cell division ATP-binding protein FtsE n=1 Tax=Microbacterium sp. 179-B 1A2 NHS TaxID=3142383 RepID=UPI0039A02C16
MIRFENVTKRYRGTSKPALSEVEFDVQRGEFVFLVGASGSGKSSCLRLILREDTPSDGRVVVLGRDVRGLGTRKVPYFRRHIGSVFQDFRLLPNKTVFQNVAFTLQVIGSSRAFIQQSVPEALALVGLEGKQKRFPHELSGGEQQRVAIARAIVNRPQILLADEPTGNLDPATSIDIMQLLARINAGGTTVVMATHEAGFVDQMQRRVIELSGGVIVRDERHGGYGDTSQLPTLAPETVKGAAATAALTAVLELQKQIASQSDPASAGPEAVSPPPPEPETVLPAVPVVPDPVPAHDATRTSEAPPAAAAAAREPDTGTRSVPIVAPEIDLGAIDGLGVADRLGLGRRDDEDEVGPTA